MDNFDAEDDLEIIDDEDDFSSIHLGEVSVLSDLISDIRKALISGFANNKISCVIDQQERSVDSLFVGIGHVRKSNLIKFLEGQLCDKSENNTCADFRDAINNAQQIIGKSPYIVYLIPDEDNYSLRYDRGTTLNQSCYILANPCLTISMNGEKTLSWHVQSSDNVDLESHAVLNLSDALCNPTGSKNQRYGL